MAKILIVEDEALLAQDWAAALELDGHAVSVCREIPLAKRAIERDWPDIVVLDFFFKNQRGSLHSGGGMALAARLRQRALKDQLPMPGLIGVTASEPDAFFPFDMFEQVEKASRATFDSRLRKPFQPAMLVSAVDALLAR